MSGERSEDVGLFKKLVEWEEIWLALRDADLNPVHIAVRAHGLCEIYMGELHYLAENRTTPHENLPGWVPPRDKAWVYREAVRMSYLWPRVDLDWLVLAQECEPDNPEQFFRWCVAGSFQDVTKIRYTPSAEYGKADRQIVTTLGKFLTKHYGSVLSAGRIRDWQNAWTSHTKPAELQFAETPDEVEHVYRNGPDSCMSHDLCDYYSDEHPSRLWGHCKHTRVAYMEEDGEIAARALVRDDKMQYIRIYPNCAPRFVRALEQAGYKQGDCEGLIVPAIRSGRGWLMPYCDGADWGEFVKDGIKLSYDRGEFGVKETGGVVSGYDEDEYWYCPRCGAEHESDDAYRRSDDGVDHCDSCADDFVEAIGRHGRGTFHADNVTYMECIDDYVYDHPDAHKLACIVQLDDGEWVHEDDAVLIDGDYVLKEDAVELSNGDWVREEDAVQDENGDWVHKDDLPMAKPEKLEEAGQQRLELPAPEVFTEPEPGSDEQLQLDRVILNRFDDGAQIDAIAHHLNVPRAYIWRKLVQYGRVLEGTVELSRAA